MVKIISINCGLNQFLKITRDPRPLKAHWERYEILNKPNIPLIWQLDGRPMYGDLSPNSNKDKVKLFERIGSDIPSGLVQLAGGKNEKTHEFLKSNNLPDRI